MDRQSGMRDHRGVEVREDIRRRSDVENNDRVLQVQLPQRPSEPARQQRQRRRTPSPPTARPPRERTPPPRMRSWQVAPVEIAVTHMDAPSASSAPPSADLRDLRIDSVQTSKLLPPYYLFFLTVDARHIRHENEVGLSAS